MPAIGTVVGGQYQILSILGKGGEACVYLVQDLRLRKKWAIKEIAHHPKTRVQERRSQRLINEAAVLRELSHPNLPRVVDIFSQDDVTYIVMDYIEGVSLEEYVKEAGMVTEEQVIRWGISIAKTLLYLHAQQPPVIYRDLKPSNLILTEAGELMLVDFGIAGAQSIACGTRAFAAPEQIREGTSDIRSDIYAFGRTVLYLLCGGGVKKPEISPDLKRILAGCLAHDPECRYSSFAPVLYDLYHPGKPASYVRKKKAVKRGSLKIAAAVLTMALLAGTAGILRVQQHTKQAYAACLKATGSIRTRKAAYYEAAALMPEREEALNRLLSCFEEEGRISREDAAAFDACLQAYMNGLPENENPDAELLYDTGITFLYYYSGGDDSFRERLLYARPYFEQAAQCGLRGEHQLLADSYLTLCGFYAAYVMEDSAESPHVPDRKSYETLLLAISETIDDLAGRKEDGMVCATLMFGREYIRLLRTYAGGLAASGISKEQVAYAAEKIAAAADAPLSGRADIDSQRLLILSECSALEKKLGEIWAA